MVDFGPLLKVKEKVIKITIRDAKVSDAHPIGSAQREIAKTPGFFCSIPDELTDENVEKIAHYQLTTLLNEKRWVSEHDALVELEMLNGHYDGAQ